MTKTDKMRLIELERGQSLEQIIRSLTEAGLTGREIADKLGVSYKTYHDWKSMLGARRVSTVRFASEEREADACLIA